MTLLDPARPLTVTERYHAGQRRDREEARARFETQFAFGLAIMLQALKEADDAWLVGSRGDRESYLHAVERLDGYISDFVSDEVGQ